MGMTFDATLKDLGRDCPHGILTEFDQPPTMRVSVLNADLSTVTKAADLVLGIGEPLNEIVHVEFQSSAAAWKHADILAYNSLLFRSVPRWGTYDSRSAAVTGRAPEH